MDLYHYKKEEVTRILKEAFESVAEVDLPESLEGIAYQKAVEMLANKTVSMATAGIDLSGVRPH